MIDLKNEQLIHPTEVANTFLSQRERSSTSPPSTDGFSVASLDTVLSASVSVVHGTHR